MPGSYQLDYHGDNRPETISQEVAWLILRSTYRSAHMADVLMDWLDTGTAVHVMPGVLRAMATCTTTTSPATFRAIHLQ